MHTVGTDSRESGASPETKAAGYYDAFISYAREDRPMVERLVSALRSREQRIWMDVQSIPAQWAEALPGEPYHATCGRPR